MTGLRLVLAVDHPRDAGPVAKALAALLCGNAASVAVVHVHQVAQGRFGAVALQPEHDADCVALDIADLLSHAGVPATGRFAVTDEDDIAGALCAAAVEEGASLIVVGTHPETDSHLRPGRTLAERVQRLSMIPVLLVPAH